MDSLPNEIPENAEIVSPEDSLAPVYVMEFIPDELTEPILNPDELASNHEVAIQIAINEIVTKLGLSEETARLMVTAQSS